MWGKGDSGFLQDARFKHPWRDYQARVLAELEGHLSDWRLHVVAAPGSGKTVLGLEVMRRLGRPALILAPTLTVRNQWIDRLLGMFTDHEGPRPDWISTDLWATASLTVVTYQALHRAFASSEADEEDEEIDDADAAPCVAEPPPADNAASKDPETLFELLRGVGTATIILDEAHHLRNEWWRVLVRLKKGLGKPAIVSLTATPPYDVERGQWDRYLELCGHIDAEISVPELVRRGDLCPHQDYIYYSLPTREERETLSAFWETVDAIAEGLLRNGNLLNELQTSPWIESPEENVERILDDPDFLTSLLVVLNAAGRPTPRAATRLLGVGAQNLPQFDAGWLETLLNGMLFRYRDEFPGSEGTMKDIERSLRRAGAIERRRVVVEEAKASQKILARSVAKLNSIQEIVSREADALGGNLRMVILADYIRREALPRNPADLEPIRNLGVAPIFEFLRRAEMEGVRLGVLTGSLCFIPADVGPRLEALAEKRGVPRERLRMAEARHDPAYLTLEITGDERALIVQLVTDLFREGGVTVLVGTQALLGEGWDAPSVNSLILSSQVGSFMMSNQMRGRAMRVDPEKDAKTANIWHLATLDITSLRMRLHRRAAAALSPAISEGARFETTFRAYGNDCRTLLRRFRAFESVSLTRPPVITNQLHELGLAPDSFGQGGVERFNERVLEHAARRDALASRWNMALQGESDWPELRVKTETNYTPQGFALEDTLEALVKEAVFAAITIFALTAEASFGSGGNNFLLAVALGGVAGMLYAAPTLLKAGYLALRNGTLEGSLRQVLKALVATLHEMEAIATHPDNIRIRAGKLANGMATCDVHGVTTPDRQIILDTLEELLQPVDNPRYLLVRNSKLGALLRRDYHAVPGPIGQKKEYALALERNWSRYVGRAKVVYTRNREGRLLLLKARTSAFSSAFRRKVDRRSVWE